jgi:hypothetical protein
MARLGAKDRATKAKSTKAKPTKAKPIKATKAKATKGQKATTSPPSPSSSPTTPSTSPSLSSPSSQYSKSPTPEKKKGTSRYGNRHARTGQQAMLQTAGRVCYCLLYFSFIPRHVRVCLSFSLLISDPVPFFLGSLQGHRHVRTNCAARL